MGDESGAEVEGSGRAADVSLGGVRIGGLVEAVANVEEESAFVSDGSGGESVEATFAGSSGEGVGTRVVDCPRVSDEADSIEGVA